MAQVIGVGAVMIYAKDPASLARWYTRALGIGTTGGEAGGCVYGVIKNPTTSVETQFAIFRSRSEPGNGGGTVMVNYQVDDMDSFLDHALQQGVEIEKREDSEYGRFAHIKDPEGNPIEIWEAPESGKC